jgi:hypothetical protein
MDYFSAPKRVAEKEWEEEGEDYVLTSGGSMYKGQSRRANARATQRLRRDEKIGLRQEPGASCWGTKAQGSLHFTNKGRCFGDVEGVPAGSLVLVYETLEIFTHDHRDQAAVFCLHL